MRVDVCFRCGRKNHRSPDCRFKDAKYNKCQKTGYLANICGKKKNEIRSAAFTSRSDIKKVSVMPDQVIVHIVRQVKCNQTSIFDDESPPPGVLIPVGVEGKKSFLKWIVVHCLLLYHLKTVNCLD